MDLSTLPWKEVGEYAAAGLAVYFVIASIFQSDWWTAQRIWLFIAASTISVYYFLGVLNAIYYFLIILAINANSNDKIMRL